MMSLMKSRYNLIFDFNKIRYFPCNLSALQTSEIQNLATITDERTDILNSQKKPRIKRSSRNIRKSKKEQRNKRRSNCIRRGLDYSHNSYRNFFINHFTLQFSLFTLSSQLQNNR